MLPMPMYVHNCAIDLRQRMDDSRNAMLAGGASFEHARQATEAHYMPMIKAAQEDYERRQEAESKRAIRELKGTLIAVAIFVPSIVGLIAWLV